MLVKIALGIAIGGDFLEALTNDGSLARFQLIGRAELRRERISARFLRAVLVLDDLSSWRP